jgi:hypothetical protein
VKTELGENDIIRKCMYALLKNVEIIKYVNMMGRQSDEKGRSRN